MDKLLLITFSSLLFQNVLSNDFLREYVFPRHPILHRVRKLNPTRRFDQPFTLDFIGLAERQGYPGEQHHLTTEDGYILTIHRIPGSSKSPPKKGKPVVILQHGFLLSSDSWLITDAKSNLALTMADKGYDVWFGNMRGNSYCRSHNQLSTLEPEFWNFSYHEIGFYDLAAIIDYSLNVTGETSIIYIGHSMGTTMSYVLLSTRPIYNKKIRLTLSLAPIAYWKVGPYQILWKFLQTNFDIIKKLLDKYNIYDVLPLTDKLVKLLNGLCGSNIVTQSTCIAFIFQFTGSNPDQFNITLLPDILAQFPAGSSIQMMNHFKQNSVNGVFQQYDYGYENNYKIYGQKSAPLYKLSEITSPVGLIYSLNDPISMKENVLELANKLPNVIELYEVSDTNFNHIDFFVNLDAKILVNDKILEIISMY